MPKRSNDFQRLIYLIRVNLAEGAVVTESRLMQDRLTGKFREVDVVVEGKVGGQKVIVSVECRDQRRLTDVTWVDEMKAKHDRLDTHALILASRSGFTPEAREVAKKFGISVVTLDDIEGADLPAQLAPDGALWFKSVTVHSQKTRITVPAAGELPAQTVLARPELLVHSNDGTQALPVRAIVDRMLRSVRLRDYLFSEGTEEHKWIEFGWSTPQTPDGRPLCLRRRESSLLRPIDSIRVTGSCTIAIGRFGMRHCRMGDVTVAWGRTAIAGRDTMMVTTMESNGQVRLSVHGAGVTDAPDAP